MRKIQEKKYIQWRHVGTKENPADLGIIRGVLGVTVKTDDNLDLVMHKYNLWKAIQICWWVVRFTRNCRAKRQQKDHRTNHYRRDSQPVAVLGKKITSQESRHHQV